MQVAQEEEFTQVLMSPPAGNRAFINWMLGGKKETTGTPMNMHIGSERALDPRAPAPVQVWSECDNWSPPSDREQVDDAEVGPCFEYCTSRSTEHLANLAAVPLRSGHFLEVSVRLKVLAGPLPNVRITGALPPVLGHADPLTLQQGPLVAIAARRTVFDISAVIGAGARFGVHLAWAQMPETIEVGLDLLGAAGSVVRVGPVCVRDVSRRFLTLGPVLAGFQDL